MAVLKKTLFAENLEKYSVLIQDTDPNSKYFKITELPDTLTGGKNAFLIQGSEFLVADTIIKIEIKDSQGNIIYHEPGEGIPEYYEGTSKVIAVYVYPDTAFGPCTITILGEISEYEDTNGVRKPIPLQYKDTYNVRWQKQINVNPFLQNNTKIRFYRRPQVEITEVLKPVFTITETRVQQNGDAELFSNQQIDDLLLDRRGGYLLPDDFQYKAHLLSDTFKANMLGTTMSFTSYPDYKPEIIELVSSTEAILNTPLIENGVIQTVISTPYAITYLSGSDKKQSDFTSSYAQIKLTQLETFAGDVKRVKVFRRSKGSISDFELVQDILLESTELLRTLEGKNKAVENTGIFDTNTLENYWNTDNTLTATLSNSRLVNGVKLNGNGKFKYTSSLDLTSKTVYELQFDAFYSSSTASDLDVYISGSAPSGSSFIDTEIKIGSLIGITPTKKFENQILQFKLDLNQPSASLFFSSSQGEWHLSDLSLVVSQETAFSPDSVTFLTSIPTSIPNEIFEFKFEFYDVNNNFVPVTILEEKQFSGGTNTVIVLTQIASSSAEISSSLYAVSASISGTITTNSSSISGTIGQVSSSVSGTIGSVSASVSGSIFTLSGSVSGTIGSVSASVSGTIGQVSSSVSGTIGSVSASVSGTIGILSGSVSGSIYTLSGSVSASISNVSASISSSLSSANSQSLYTVFSASAYLDKFIFTDANGRLRRPPTASANGLYTGDDHLGFYSGGTWKTYMDSQGDFYLTSSAANGGFLAWSSAQGRLQIQGDINIQGGNAATNASLTSSLNAVSGAINSATQSLSSSVAATTFTTATGLIAKPPSVLVGSTSGLYLGSSFLGYYDGAGWKTFMANNGNFYLSGSGGDSLTWASGILNINGAINITGGNAATNASLTSSLNTANSNAQGYANNAALSASLSGSVDPISQRITKANAPNGVGLYLGSNYLGYYNGSSWRTYMASTGDFYLGSVSDTNYLEWNNATGILTIKGAINITGGNAATNASLTSSLSSTLSSANSTALSYVNAGTASLSSSIYTTTQNLGDRIFTDALGRIIKTPSTGNTSGLYLGSTNMGYYNGSAWKTYMDNTGLFYLTGSANGNALLWDGSVLSIKGAITVTGGDAATTTVVNTAAANAVTSGSNAAATAQANAISTAASDATTKANAAQTAAQLFASSAAGRAVDSGSASASAAQQAAINQAKADASASINLLANGNWTAGSGTFITARSISSPVIAGNAGYISDIFKVGPSGITLDGGNKKIFIGANGNYNNTDTPFYVDNDGKMSLKNKFVWDGSTLSLEGAINITGGTAGSALTNLNAATTSVNTSINNINTTTSNLQTQVTAVGAYTRSIATNDNGLVTLSLPATPSGAGLYLGSQYLGYYNSGWKTYMDNSGNFYLNGTNGYLQWNRGTDTLGIKGDITCTNITATTAGSIAGWTVGPNTLSKTTGSYTLKLSAGSSPGFSVTETNAYDSLDRVRINAELTIPPLVAGVAATMSYANGYQVLASVSSNDPMPYSFGDTGWELPYANTVGDYGTGVYGIVALLYANEEIYVDSSKFPNINGVLNGFTSNGGDEAYGSWTCWLKVRQFPTANDAINETNQNTAYGTEQILLAKADFYEYDGTQIINEKTVYGGTIKATGGGGFNTQGPAVWYRIEVIQYWDISAAGPSATMVVRRPPNDIKVSYTRVGNGYSIFSPGGLQVYQGFRNYMNVADVTEKIKQLDDIAEAGNVNFFEIKGKSQIFGTLNVSEGLTGKSKQFKIDHPADDRKWLYHTAIESPRADLIYRGKCELVEGFASCSIDSASRMSDGTFEALTKNPQIFLQNDTGFDRVKGNLFSGSLQIYSENNQSTDTISWMVVSERKDPAVADSPLYDVNGNYKPERLKLEYQKEIFDRMKQNRPT